MSDQQAPGRLDGPDAQSSPPKRRSNRMLAPIAVAVVIVLVLAGIGTAIALVGNRANQPRTGHANAGSSSGTGSRGGKHVPPGGVLHLSSVLLAGPAYGPLRLVGTLPTDAPGKGVSFTLPAGPAPAPLVRKLAHALGLPAPHREGNAWVAQRGATLRVADTAGWPWTYASGRTMGPLLPGCASQPGRQQPSGVMSCQVGPRSRGSAAASPAPPSHPASLPPGARSAIRRLLTALGERGAAESVHGTGQYVTVTVARTVAGLPVAGFATNIVVAGSRISSAGGWLAGAARPLAPGNSYPLIGAKAAYERVAHAPTGMRPNLCELRPGNRRAECIGGEPRRVTGGRPGLAVARTVPGGVLLVPAWLFTLAGDGGPGTSVFPAGPLAVVAVAGNHLQAPAGLPAPLRGSGG